MTGKSGYCICIDAGGSRIKIKKSNHIQCVVLYEVCE